MQVRRRAAVNYAEPRGNEGLGSDEELEQEEALGSPQAKRRITPSRAPKPRKRHAELVADIAEGDTTLLDIVKKHGTAIAVAAKDWVDRYKTDRAAATAELLSLLVQSCGVAHSLSSEDVEEGEVDALKERLDKLAVEEGLDDPFHAKGQKSFHSNYHEMWDKVMREMHAADLLFDQYLLDRVVHMVTALNTSAVRDFRRVGTLTAVQLITSWIHVTQALAEARDTAQRQLVAEEKKKGTGRAGVERAAAFKRTVERSHSRIQELQSYTDSLFQGVFSLRFRDCSEEIRACCIEGIGCWIRLMPATFLTDQYLKYIAWALSDKDAMVRRAAVTALLALYSQRDNLPTLHDFTERFLQRFSELVYDRDEVVAMKGIRLITLLVRLDELPGENVKEVYRLLGDQSHGIRHAAADLVASMLEEQGRQALEQAAAPGGGGRGSARKKKGRGGGAGGGSSDASGSSSPAELQLAGLLALQQALAVEQGQPATGAAGEDEGQAAAPRALARGVVAQVVDALFEGVPALGDWKLMVQWLQQDRAQELFGEAGVTNLASTLQATLVKATGGELLKDAAPLEPRRGAHMGRERQQAQAAARQEATLVLLKELPSLLRKVQTHPEQAAALVSCVPELQLDIYALKREERAFSMLAKAIKDTFAKHAEESVTLACVRALVHCAAEGPDTIRDAARLVLTQAGEEAAAKLAAAVRALVGAAAIELQAAVAAYEEDPEDEEELLFDTRAALVRLCALLQLEAGACSGDEVYDSLNQLVEGLSSGQQPLPRDSTQHALLSIGLVLLWRLRALDKDGSPSAASLADLSHKASLFARQLDGILAASEDEAVRQTVARLLTDLYITLGSQRLGSTPLAGAALHPSDKAVEAYWQLAEGLLLEAEEEEGEDGAPERAAASEAAALHVAQVVVAQAIPQANKLAAHLISHWGTVQGPKVVDTIKEMCRTLKKHCPDALPAIYMDALRLAHSRCEPHLPRQEDDDEAEYDEGESQRLHPLVSLAAKIAASYAGFNASAPVLTYLTLEGAKAGLRDPPASFDFLHAAAFFAQRLPAGSVAGVLQAVEAATAPFDPSEEDDNWGLYHEFITILREREAKGKAKPAMKKAAAAAAAGAPAGGGRGGGTARETRKISFAPAPGDATEESEEEEEPQQQPEHIGQASGGEEEEEEEEGGAAAPLVRSAQGRRGRLARMSSPSTVGSARGRKGRKARPGQQQQQVGEAQHAILPPFQAQAAAARPPTQEPSKDAAGVFPTEEQLPVPRKQQQQPAQRQQRRQLKPMFAVAEEEEEEEVQQSEDEDADLMDIRGRGDRQAPAEEKQPAPPQEEEVEGEDDSSSEEEEEDQRARRRRRR